MINPVFPSEMSYFFNVDVANLLLHVPMVPEKTMLRLVKLNPFPMPVTRNYSFVPDVDDQLLAVAIAETGLSAQLSESRSN